MRITKKLFLIISPVFLINLISSCNVDKTLNVNMISNTLDIKYISKDENNFSYTIYKKEGSYQGRLPDKLNEVKLNDKVIDNTYYSYNPSDGKFVIPITNGELKITSELTRTYSIKLDSTSLNKDIDEIDEHKDLNLKLKLYNDDTYYMPDDLNEIKIGDKVLNKDEYTFDKTTGLVHIDKSYINGNIIIKADAIDKGNFGFKVTFICDPNVTISIYKTTDYTQTPTEGEITYSVDKDGNLIKDGSGQVNFKINIADGYEVDMIFIKGLYKNCKGKEETLNDDIYRITKIKSDLEIQITTAQMYMKDFSCVGDTNNKTFDFSWDFRNNEDIKCIKIAIESIDGTYNDIIYENKYKLSNIKYDQRYKITFDPQSKSNKVLGKKRVIKYMIDPNKIINMPKLKINTKDGVLPTYNREYPGVTTGMHEGKDAYIKADLDLYSSNNNVIYSSKENSNSCKVKTRGNTSAMESEYKKPLKIKLDTPIDLLDGYRVKSKEGVNYKHKEYNLIPYTDYMSELLGFASNRALEFEYAHEFIYTMVYINEDYLGLYALSETNDVGLGEGESQGRYKISESGFLIENDYFYTREEISFKTSFSSKNYRYTFKHPDVYDKEDSLGYVDSVKKYIISIEKILVDTSKPLSDYIDLNSFAKWIVSYDLIGQSDDIGANRFVYKYDDKESSKLKMGTPWDFSHLFTHTIKDSGIKTDTEFLFFRLMRITEFKNEIKAEYAKYKDSFLSSILDEINKINKDEFDKLISLENEKYESSFHGYEESFNKINDYLKDRIVAVGKYYDDLK